MLGRILSIAAIAAAVAQSQTGVNRLAFAVTSVRPGNPDAPPGPIRPMPGGQSYIATNAPLLLMVMSAYRITNSQILGAPNWMVDDPWDVNAKAERPSTSEQLQEMFQALLAERFKLRFHRSTKEIAAYILSIEKAGSKLKRNDSKDAASNPIRMERRGVLVGDRVSMSDLCWNLTFLLGAPVVDKTRLGGFYDLTLDWSPAVASPQSQETPETAALVLNGPERSSALITAVHKQLGLKLEYRKAPVEVFVIDQVERPTDN